MLSVKIAIAQQENCSDAPRDDVNDVLQTRERHVLQVPVNKLSPYVQRTADIIALHKQERARVMTRVFAQHGVDVRHADVVLTRGER